MPAVACLLISHGLLKGPVRFAALFHAQAAPGEAMLSPYPLVQCNAPPFSTRRITCLRRSIGLFLNSLIILKMGILWLYPIGI